MSRKSKSIEDTRNMFKKMTTKATDSKSKHQFLVSGHKFNVDTFYSPHKAVGSGAYGVVCATIDNRYNRKVAIKKCSNAFEDIIDGKRILREVRLLQAFDHENICPLLDMIPPTDPHKFTDVYIVLNYMESDLHKIIYSRNKLTDEHYQYFVYQILRGLKYLHSKKVIHRDLKPSNLLVNSNCDLKICDFGLARGLDWKTELTEYVVTRWYRAPEIMCSHQDYNEKIDMWSVGTILAEMIRGKPLFAGDHYIHQLNLIFELIGTPNLKDDLECVSNVKALKYIQKLSPKTTKSFEKYFGGCHGATPDAIDLLKKLLRFNPNKRISVDEALEHPYFRALHSEKNKQSADAVCEKEVSYDWEFKCKTKKGLKQQMYKACVEVRAESQAKWIEHQKNASKQDKNIKNEH